MEWGRKSVACGLRGFSSHLIGALPYSLPCTPARDDFEQPQPA